MITIIIDFTEAENAKIDALESQYQMAIKAIEEVIQQSRSDDAPDINGSIEAFQEWEAKGSDEWKAARKKRSELMDELNNKRSELVKQAAQRQFDELNDDLNNIYEDAKKQAEKTLVSLYDYHKDSQKRYSAFTSADVVSLGGGKWLLDADATKNRISGSLHLHIKALERDKKLLGQLTIFINDLIKNSEFVAAPGTKGTGELVELIPGHRIPEAIISTKYPANYITPTDKATQDLFGGDFPEGERQKLAMERRGSKRKINALVSIDFDNLNGKVQISGRKELTAYDREVHDAIITLYVDGGNEYITPQMIYQVMTGNRKAYLNPKQAEAISDSITKCMYSRVVIDASEEAKMYGFDKLKYDGNLISGKRVTVSLNGNVVECLRVLGEPILYEYADKKNQIGRFDIKLLNSPINKTEEIITLQGYLTRRVLAMKNGRLSPTIVYDTIYKQLEVSAASDGALRKKKNKVRGQIKSILDFWKQEGFILGYCENKRKTELYSVTIRV